ncbi:hypothetical protein JHK87_020323 [Glycine soja]|nr:hypothetical protein JHK87_020323 [Glycine soja]
MAEASVTVGGKASSISSSSVFAVATGRAHVRIDSSALDRLPKTETTSASPQQRISVPDFLTLEESRAFLLVLLNNLVLSNAPSRVPLLLSQTLNSNPPTFHFHDGADVTQQDLLISSTLLAVSAIVDHQSAALSAFADVAAAFSCEALKADATPFNLMDSGDGHTSKDEVAVAANIRVLLNGSKSVGKEKIRSVARVPKVHGSVREQAKALHSRMRVELNSGVKGVVGSEEAVCTVLLPLAAALRELGECSFARAKSNLEVIAGDGLKFGIGEVFGKECSAEDGLSGGFNKAVNLFLGKEYGKFAHEVFVLLGLVWKVVAWEAVTAVAVLQAAELNEVIEGVKEIKVEDNAKEVEKKKKKVVLGKGTSSILALIKERLLSGGQIALGTWVGDFLSLLDLAKPEFNEFLLKVKDVVDSNESRRLPKIPKGTRDFAKEQMTIRKKAFAIIEEVFERHGATALDTPVFELRETLMGKYGEDSKLIYDLADQVVRILTELLDELDIGEYEIKLNHRKLLDGMMQICGVPPEKFRTICSSIDKLDKQSFQQIRKEMVEEKGLTAETADRIETFVKEKGSPLALLSKFKQEGSDFSKHKGASVALEELEILFIALEKSKRIDKVMARPTKTEVLVSIVGNDFTLAAELAGELWDARVKAEFLVNKRRTKHFEYAKESRIPWIVLVYEQEIKEEGVVQLKNLEANIDIKISRAEFVEELRRRLYP